MQLIDRRTFLRRGGLTCAGLSPLVRASHPLFARAIGPNPVLGSSACDLRPVDVDRHRVLQTVVGLRPYRPSGFVVRPEKVDDTLVIHNYGHGGAGITLSWGTAQLALQAGCQSSSRPVAVLGCGAVGLATARLLQEAGYQVTIYTKALPADTTSHVAGGAWSPFLVADPQHVESKFSRQLQFAAEFARGRFQSMVGKGSGVHWVRSYSITRGRPDASGNAEADNLFSTMRPEYREVPPAEHPFSTDGAVWQSETLLIEPPRYLQALLDAYRDAGGTIVFRNIADRAAITALPEKLVFHCTGMGAKDLFQDPELTPVRGQLTILKPQPEIDYAVSHNDLYMLPRTDGIVLGGTYELGVSSLMPDMEKMQRILMRHSAFFRSYRNAPCSDPKST